MKRSLRATPAKLLLALALLGVPVAIGLRAWNRPSGSELAEDRRDFHQRQIAFKSICERGVVGKRVEDLAPLFGGPPSSAFQGRTYGWKGWPCELVAENGLVEGVFYHDFPFTTQPLPPDYRATHARPYFERHPEFIDAAYTGRWDGKGGYLFEKTSKPK